MHVTKLHGQMHGQNSLPNTLCTWGLLPVFTVMAAMAEESGHMLVRMSQQLPENVGSGLGCLALYRPGRHILKGEKNILLSFYYL